MNSGLRQGRSMSPKLCNTCTDKILRERIRNLQFNNVAFNLNKTPNTVTLLFACDQTTISDSEYSLQEMIHELNRRVRKYNLTIIPSKTKLMEFIASEQRDPKL